MTATLPPVAEPCERCRIGCRRRTRVLVTYTTKGPQHALVCRACRLTIEDDRYEYATDPKRGELDR